jgi:hypothetical protein
MRSGSGSIRPSWGPPWAMTANPHLPYNFIHRHALSHLGVGEMRLTEINFFEENSTNIFRCPHIYNSGLDIDLAPNF